MSDYKPPFTLTNRMLDLTTQFSEELGGWLSGGSSKLTPMLRRGNRIKTIQASLEIEQNTLTIEQVTAVIDGKMVLGIPKEIQEVKNAFAAYEELNYFKPANEGDLLKAHKLLMVALVDDAGAYRKGTVGVFQQEKLIHMAPPANQLSCLMGDLFAWLSKTELHPLLVSCLFHYEFECIHPFSDGNGRMGRFWQTLILSKWRPELAWLPVETIVRDRQQDYYAALASSDKQAEATLFIEFMLEALVDALKQALRTDDGANDGVKIKLDEVDRRILALCQDQPYITQDELKVKTGKSLSTIQRRIRKLKKHYLKRIGSHKTGYWEVIN